MLQTCTITGEQFNIPEDEIAFIKDVSPVFNGKKYDLPLPTQCPDERHRQRGIYRCALLLHKRRSDLSGKPVLSVYDEDTPFPIYSVDEWWEDTWDGLDNGQDFDASKPFFEQFEELYAKVPRMANLNEQAENCEYSYSCGRAKNVYYSLIIHRSEDVYYSERCTSYNQVLVDCYMCFKSRHLYDCAICKNCESSTHLESCSDCGDCHYCIDCQGCTDCILCSNLRNKTHYVRNKQVSPEEYKKIRAELLNGKHQTTEQCKKELDGLKKNAIYKALNNMSTENCTGDGLLNSAHCIECYNSVNLENCRYCIDLTPSDKCVTSMDFTSGGIGELIYNCVGLGGGNYHMLMCVTCRLCSDLIYCTDCFQTKNCFGCVGLKNKQFCIFNKQYSEEEYNDVVEKIIEHMQSTGEWGHFFPATLSPLAYNATLAGNYFPLTKEEVQARGLKWHEDSDDVEATKVIDAAQLPDDLSQIPDDVTNWAIKCEQTSRPFRITQQELDFYRQMTIAIPHEHPDVRMSRRQKTLNPPKLWKRNCPECGKEMQTTYTPDREERILCEECYLKEVY